MGRQDLGGALERAADDVGEIHEVGARRDGARFEPRHVEQIGDETVEPLGLFHDGADEFVLRRAVERLSR